MPTDGELVAHALGYEGSLMIMFTMEAQMVARARIGSDSPEGIKIIDQQRKESRSISGIYLSICRETLGLATGKGHLSTASAGTNSAKSSTW